MPVNRSENTKDIELSPNNQPITMRLVVTFAIVLIALPLLPAIISNLAYSFSGQAPKIYWYLSRASGFIALSILWVSMAMGLGLTNKLARLWPGAPAAFAVHEYVSLLGLLFAAYHALVLIGDHYVDFSLPRLLVPFSIQYEPFWVGLGQIALYTWVIVLLSFYVRQYIGQKTWRIIHYANFSTYMMGLFHGLFSGTDGTAGWAHWYYGLSGGSLIALIVYRIYVTVHKPQVSRPKPVSEAKPSPQVVTDANTPTPTATTAEMASQTPPLEAASSPPEPQTMPTVESAPTSEPVPVTAVTENIPQPIFIEEEQIPVSEYVTTQTQLPSDEPTPVVIRFLDEISLPPPDPVLRLKKNQYRSQMQTTSYKEPVTLPTMQMKRESNPTQPTPWHKVYIPNVKIDAPEQSEQAKPSPLILRIKENMRPNKKYGTPENKNSSSQRPNH
jgi:hypothetical protein